METLLRTEGVNKESESWWQCSRDVWAVMAALLWMLAWLPHVLPDVSELPQPINVTLTSDHFNPMLKWEHGPGTPTGVFYHIEVILDRGTSWVPVSGCERVQHPLVCNLTEAFSDPTYDYIVRLTARLEAHTSQPVSRNFQPIKDTHLDLPLLTVTPCGNDLCVDLRPPMEHLRKIYDSLNYKLRIKRNDVDRADRAQFFQDVKNLTRVIVKDLAHGREYCVSVCFSDSLVRRQSNYSQPVCAFTSGIKTADMLILAVLCLLAMCGVVVVALLVVTGFISLITMPLPLVLSSIHHIDKVLVVAPCTSLTSHLNLKPTPPSSGEKRNSQTSSCESDGESVTESTGGSTGGDYKLKVGTYLLSLSSSYSSSLSAPLSPEPEPPVSTETHSNAELNHVLSTALYSLPESDQRASDPSPPTDTDTLTVGRIQPNEEEEEEEHSEGVNLLTLTFGRHEEKVEPESSSASCVCEGGIGAMYNTSPILPSQTWDTKEVVTETISCSVEEEDEEEDKEEEEEDSGYMRRPCTDVIQNLL